MRAGLQYENPRSHILIPLGVGKNQVTSPLTGSATLAPSFGATVDFTLIYGAGGGPTWTFQHFDGPYSASSGTPSSGGLFNVLRTNKDTLVLSFAQVAPKNPNSPAYIVPSESGERGPEKSISSPEIEAAGQTAQQNVTRMVLQRLGFP
jgi:hypothetical protein